MSIGATEALEHLDRVVATEAALSHPKSDLFANGTNVTLMHNATFDTFWPPHLATFSPDATDPRPSHRIIHKLFLQIAARPGKARSKAAQQFLTDHMYPLAEVEVDTDTPIIQARPTVTRVGFCDETEPRFVRSIKQIDRVAKGEAVRGQPRLSTYHDEHGRPVAIRKTTSEHNGILVANVRIDGTLVPAGTFVGFGDNFNDGSELTGKYSPYKSGNYRYETYQIGTNFKLQPLRLSPWVYTKPLDRALWGVNTDAIGGRYFDSARGNLAAQTELADFQHAAAQIMELCA